MEKLSTLCMDAHLTPEQFQAMTGISRRTFYRYQHAPPPWAVLLCQLLAGDLGRVNKHWHGYVINARGEVCTPNNYAYQPGEILAIYWERQLNRILKADYRKLKKRLDAMSDEPDHQCDDARA